MKSVLKAVGRFCARGCDGVRTTAESGGCPQWEIGADGV